MPSSPQLPSRAGGFTQKELAQMEPLIQGVHRKINNLMLRAMTGVDQEFMDTLDGAKSHEIVEANFRLIQAKVFQLLQDDAALDRQSRIVLGLAEELVKEGAIDREYLVYLRSVLKGADVEKIARTLETASRLARTSQDLEARGNLGGQLKILERFLFRVFEVAQERSVRELILQTITELKAASGMPLDQVQAWINAGVNFDEDGEVAEDDNISTAL